MKRVYLTIVLLVAISVSAFSQKKAEASLADTYDRSSLSLILLNHGENQYASKVADGFSGVQLPDKYFNNKIDVKTINSPFASGFIGDASKAIAEELNKQKIGNQIVAYWYSRQNDGTMSADLFLERGMYNATDADVLKAKGTKRGVEAIKDFGDKLISKSYIAVVEYTTLTFTDNSQIHGWTSNAKIYLFKVKFEANVQATLYNDLWIYEDDAPAVKASKKAAFDNMEFSLEFVTSASAFVTATQPQPSTSLGKFITQKSNDVLFSEMLQKGVDESIYNTEKKNEEFRVKTALYSTHPLKAKIGKKEGLAVDHRYFVYEYVYKEKTNTTEARRRGVIRAKKIIDNRGVATGNTQMSSFYQVAGGHLEPGFTLQQRNDAGIGFGMGYEVGEVGGVTARLEVNGGRFIGIPSLYIYLGGGAQMKTYDFVNTQFAGKKDDQDMMFYRYEIGVGKGLHFFRHFELQPYIAYGEETATNTDWEKNAQFGGDKVSAGYIKFGANLAMNLKYNLQIVGGVGVYSFLTPKDGDGNDIAGEPKYDEIFPDRKGATTYVGLRFQF